MFCRTSILFANVFISIIAYSYSKSANSTSNEKEAGIALRFKRYVDSDVDPEDVPDLVFRTIGNDMTRRSLGSSVVGSAVSEENFSLGKSSKPFWSRRNIETNNENKNIIRLNLGKQSTTPNPNVSTTSTTSESTTTSTTTTSEPETPSLLIASATSSNVNLANLYTMLKLRDNILFIIGYLLQVPVDFLTEPQYTSLNIIFKTIQERRASIDDILPDLSRLSRKDINQQIKIIMQALEISLPPYVSCAAKFWVAEIDQNKIDLNALVVTTSSESLNFLADIRPEAVKIATNREFTKSMAPRDARFKNTEHLLGPVFVKILHDIEAQRISLSQQVFGIILANVPIIPYNPILDEHIRYILEVTRDKRILAWQEIEFQSFGGDPYRLVKMAIKKILNMPNIPLQLKHALTYIKNHLKPASATHSNPSFQLLHDINADGFNFELLLSPIVPGVFSSAAFDLKNRLLRYLQKNEINVQWVVGEVDRFRYNKPLDLLFAFLTKLQIRIPAKKTEIIRTVTALLSTLIIEMRIKEYSPHTSKDVDIMTLFGILSNPDSSQNINNIYDSSINILFIKPNLQSELTSVIPAEKESCDSPKRCLINTLQRTDQLTAMEIPRQLERNIMELKKIYIMDLGSVHSPASLRHSTNDPRIVYQSSMDSSNENWIEPEPISSNSNEHLVFSDESEEITENRNINQNININSNTNFFDGGRKSPDINRKPPVDDLEIVLPPKLNPDKSTSVFLSNTGIPVVGSVDIRDQTTTPTVLLPPVKVLLRFPSLELPLGKLNPEFMEQIVDPLSKIFGANYLSTILGANVNDSIRAGKYPTTAALILEVLNKVKTNPLMKNQKQLLLTIKKYISSMDFISFVLLPVVVSVKKLYSPSGVIYSSINIANPQLTEIGTEPPENPSKGTLTVPIVDPHNFLQPVNPRNPLEGLLPNLEANAPGADIIDELKNLLTDYKIKKLIPNVDPRIYPNKGTLLMVILQKLRKVPQISANVSLKNLIMGYIHAIRMPAVYIKVSPPRLNDILDKQPSDWQPDTKNLLEVLPQPSNSKEIIMMRALQRLLTREDLFEVLNLSPLSTVTSRSDLLKMIFDAVLTTSRHFDKEIVTACRYYKTKILVTGMGSVPITWSTAHVFMFKTEVKLGKLIETVINYDELPADAQRAYGEILTYFTQNPNILQGNNDFPFDLYKTQGSFMKALFSYLSQKREISEEAKGSIKSLVPYITLTGPGAKPMPSAKVERLQNSRRNISAEDY